MTAIRYDVVAIGNAIVDVLAKADDEFLTRHRLAKGTMTLIDAPTAERLYAAMGPAIECSGGSAANTAVGVASLGGRAAYIGRVRDDQLGAVFGHDIGAAGVHFASKPAADGPPTARCLVMVTPDAHRTLNTYLGACVDLGPEAVDGELIAASRITYLEGYLWDKAPAKAAFRKAMDFAHQAKRQVALTLSDPFCVDRHRAEFRALVDDHIDILFANESEILSLYQVKDFAQAAAELRRRHPRIAVVTRSAMGCVVIGNGEEIHAPAEHVSEVVDTTGAGDLFAAGFLYGLTHGGDLRRAARIGAIAAAEIISHLGARPERSLKELLSQRLGAAA
jgi:sugar/nucleoside kinase (ribokinase family)